jgi:putative PIN family toxin of toxin-antitoxin system
MVRVTADTNIYISALNFGGKPLEILNAARLGNIELVISQPILNEITRVLLNRFYWPEHDMAVLNQDLGSFTIWVEPKTIVTVITDDPSDNRILECAVAAGAQYIVSGDNHLLALKEYAGIKILQPSAFLEELKGKSEG